MAYLLAGQTIRRPNSMEESNSTQAAVMRTLSGAYHRDLFGTNKRIWICKYEKVKPTDFTTIKSIYDTYLSTNTPQTWQVTETNYTVAQTSVHVLLDSRSFNTRGDQYLSEFTLMLQEV